MLSRKVWRPLVMLSVPAFLMAATTQQPRRVSLPGSLSDIEKRVWREPLRESQFVDVLHTSLRALCEETRAPEALTTPNPVLAGIDPSFRVKVSFIVGTDGRVHSPLILESAGPVDDHSVLEAVRGWRYRPALCNGIPTETEGKIEFSSR